MRAKVLAQETPFLSLGAPIGDPEEFDRDVVALKTRSGRRDPHGGEKMWEP